MAQRTRGTSPHDLVHFGSPPVGEVALTFQFSGEAVDLDVLARFAAEIREDLPRVERHPLLPPMRESFDIPPLEQTFEIKLDPNMTLPRTWFVSEDGTRLVQLQADRISHNWRRMNAEPYPRYTKLRRDFGRYVKILVECLEASGRSMPGIDMSEVHYVNPVSAGGRGHGGGHPELARIVNRLRPRPPRAFLPHVEDSQLLARWRIPASELTPSGDDRPVGRLVLTAGPGLKPPALEPIYIINLVGRVIPLTPDLKPAWKALDAAHKWVVLGFQDLTTPQMHMAWGLKEGRQK